MGLLDYFNKKNDTEERSLYRGDGSALALTMLLGGGIVKADQLKSIPTAKTSLELICNSIAQLPIYLYKEQNGEAVKVPNDKRVMLLNNEPNEFADSVQFKRKLVEDYILYGKALSYVERAGNKVLHLHGLDADKVQFKYLTTDGFTWSKIEVQYMGAGGVKILPYDNLLLIDGGSNGVLKSGERTLQLALNEVEFSKSLLENFALPTGVIETASKMSETAVKRLRKGWESLYGGARNAGRTVVLEEGLTYKPISLKPDELQLTDSKKVTTSEIARLFNVPESMINSNLNKYNNNAAENLHFLQYTLSPIISAIESALDKSLLLESEKEDGYYFRFDVTEILRGTPKEQAEAVGSAFEKGLLSINEARAMLDKNPIQKDYFILSLGDILYDAEKDEITVPNTSTVIDDKKGSKNKSENTVGTVGDKTNENGITS
ncbi:MULTISPECIES: phage portal protein [Bacillus cereus group]|uniref:phage portal protein n=1 Tax=Bacillus cereus group TaxID=86661 RepID=UPI0007786549|nr:MULTISPECIES: phage portal protein [Bacillus cereus group]KXY03892.1 portal protein [Bacillus cereus]ARZ62170.1 phage portal protein [Bacillus thuringiensis]MCC2436634.1 phage portal protein [Bacillus paranthracis]MCU5079366.1 phage portal protein [Bacillus cereus]MDG1605593.1 phage portal protein [Bacillus paranthracis]